LNYLAYQINAFFLFDFSHKQELSQPYKANA